MQNKHLCVLIYIWTKGEVGLSQFKPSSKIFLLTVPRRCFFCGPFMLFLSCFCYAFVRVWLLMNCGHLLGKGWPLGSRLWCLIVKLSLSHWYPGSGVVLECIDSWSLPSFLLWFTLGLRDMFKPSSNCFTDRSKAVLLLWILSILVLCLSCLFLAALWSPAGKVLTSCPSYAW